MYSYKNRKGELVKVSENHLETAVELKKLLQKESNSNRCSWAKHRKMMIKEGYDDSDNGESYRQLIIRYQRSIGDLSPANMEVREEEVKGSNLESYKELVGDNVFHKRETQKYLKEINKAKRDIVDGTLFIEEVTKTINNVLNSIKWEEILNHTFSPVNRYGKTRMVALISDWHIGALVDVEDNKFNYNIAVRRINEYIEKIMNIAKDRNVYYIDVVYMGDMIEGHFMRSGQAYDVEFPTSEQMARGGQLLIEMLTILSSRFEVSFRSFAGNHDRINQSDKNGNVTGDTSIVVVNKIVKVFVEASKIKSLKFIETHHYHAKLVNVNGINIKLVHGDNEKKADAGKIHDHSSRDSIIYNIIAYGHFHHYAFNEVGVNKFEMRVGSLKGSDDYSERLGLGSAPSQGVILVNADGSFDAMRIGLS